MRMSLVHSTRYAVRPPGRHKMLRWGVTVMDAVIRASGEEARQ